LSSALLEVDGLVKRFGGVAAVDGATFSVQAGTITSLIGPNGAGKTTAFNAIAGFHRADGGRVVFDGRRIDRRPAYRIARAGLVRTFQSARALSRMSVLDNMLLAGASQPGEQLWRGFLTPGHVRARERAVRERAVQLLERVRLNGLADEYAGTLSGGQRKLLEFARALMPEPAMVMLDEPMAGVNPSLGLELLEHMQALRDTGTTFLLVEHDLEAVMMVSDQVHVMSAGKVIASGTPEEVTRNSEVIDAYLGTYRPARADA
jgi:branched-chain amino acid transport system ATP-binding protein